LRGLHTFSNVSAGEQTMEPEHQTGTAGQAMRSAWQPVPGLRIAHPRRGTGTILAILPDGRIRVWFDGAHRPEHVLPGALLPLGAGKAAEE
jgi:hypothetical protein